MLGRKLAGALLLVMFEASVPAQASATVIGMGCLDSNGRVSALSTSQLPTIGNANFSLDLSMAPPMSPSFIFGALAAAPVPWSLGLGSGCDVYLEQTSMLLLVNAGLSPLGPLITGAPGAVVHPFPIPNDPGLVGLSVYVQAATLDPALPLGFVVSNALRVTFG